MVHSPAPDGHDRIRIYTGLAARTRLQELGVEQSEIEESVDYALRHWATCTRNDPPNYAGITLYAKMLRGLRDRLRRRVEPWTNSNARNFATVVHPSGSHAITVSAGNSSTGREDETPWTRSEKGPAAHDAVTRNQLQPGFELIEPSFLPFALAAEPMQTWFLLHYVDLEADEIRVELSLPATINQEGYLTSWSERIVLDARPLTPFHLDLGDRGDDDGDIDVPVGRRA